VEFYPQGRNEIRWCQGQETSLAPPWSNLRSFGSKCTVLKKVWVTLLGRIGAPRSDSAPGEFYPLAPLVSSLDARVGSLFFYKVNETGDAEVFPVYLRSIAMLYFAVRCVQLRCLCSAGISNLFLTMCRFSISTDEHVALTFLSWLIINM